jgi:hypothetical protein
MLKRIQYTFVKEPDASEKLAPQARQILDLIKAAGSILKTDLLAQMKDSVVTRQGHDRILAFYQNNPLSQAGYVKIERVDPPAEEMQKAEQVRLEREQAKADKKAEREQQREAKRKEREDAKAAAAAAAADGEASPAPKKSRAKAKPAEVVAAEATIPEGAEI